MRGSYNPTLMRDTQVRAWFNKEGVQVSKDALNELHRWIENHLKLVSKKVKEQEIKRISYNNITSIFDEIAKQW